MKSKVLTMSLVCLMGVPVLGTRGPTADLEEGMCGSSRQTQGLSIDDQLEAIGAEGAKELRMVWNALKPYFQTPSGATISFLIFAALVRWVVSPSLE